METSAKPGLFRELLRRRVLQIIGLYLGAIFAVMEFTDMIVEQYSLSDVTIDVVLAGMASFFPAVIVLAWGFGAPGKDVWGRVEKITLPVNVLFTLTLIVILIFSKDVESVVETVQTTDENGQVVVREVPKQKYVNRVQIFFFDPSESLNEEDKWISYGLPFMLSTELNQNPFIIPSTLYTNASQGSFWQVKRAGFVDGLNIPLGLAKTVARDSNSDYFVTGSVSQSDGVYLADVKIFNSKTGQALSQASIVSKQAYQLNSEIAEFVKEQIDVQSAGEQLSNYLEASQRLTNNLKSMQYFINGMNNWIFNNDHNIAQEDFLMAIEEDPSFVDARINLSQLLSDKGRFAESLQQVQEAMFHSYKLSESQNFRLKAISYALNGNRQEQREVYRVWNELEPNSVEAKNALASSYLWSGNEIEPTITVLKESLQLDPNQRWIYNRLGILYEVLQEYETSIYYYNEDMQRDASSILPYIALARIARKQGDSESARNYIQKAMFLRSDMVSPILALADLELREGNLEQAQMRHQEALLVARAARQKSSLYSHLITYFMQTGEIQAAFSSLQAYQQSINQYERPLDGLISSKLSYMYLYTEAGKSEQALQELEELKGSVQKPFDKIISLGYLFHYLSVDKPEEASSYLQELDELLRSQGLAHLYHVSKFGEGLLQSAKGNHDSAVYLLRQAKTLLESSILILQEDHVSESIRYYLLLSLYDNNELEQATQVAQDILKEWPYHPLVNLQLAIIEEQRGNLSTAQEALAKTLEMWQNADQDYQPKHAALALKTKIEESLVSSK